MQPPTLPPLHQAAFLLDLDGTLIDIAPAPDQVIVPPGLKPTLQALRQRCGDAVAIVTGRPIAQVDGLLNGAPYAIAGEHGAAIRHAPGRPVVIPVLPALPQGWLASAAALVARCPGAMLERKAHGFVLHYRAAPIYADALHAGVSALLAGQAAFAAVSAKMAWEVRPALVHKGTAVRALMAEPPFAGRLPIFIGDDVTDEDGIIAARALGGLGLRVGEQLPDPHAVRQWLAHVVGA